LDQSIAVVHWPIAAKTVRSDVPTDFLTFLVEKPFGSPTALNQSVGGPTQSNAACNFSEQLRVATNLQQRMAVVGNGSIDVGNKTPIRKPVTPLVERLAGDDSSSELRIAKAPLKAAGGGICRAMSQQRGDSGRGNESAPQKFLQLVGCRDSKARPEPAARPRPVPAKQ
jgi:hypothetical protein